MAGTEGQETPGELRAKLEAANARNRELEGQVQGFAAVQLENAAFKAGLSLTGPKLKALFAAHEGDDFTPEALQATAKELGFTAEATTPPAGGTTTPPPPDTSGHGRIDAASQGATTPSPKSWDDRFKEARSQGREATEALMTEYVAERNKQLTG
jgi:hypothetical protein